MILVQFRNFSFLLFSNYLRIISVLTFLLVLFTIMISAWIGDDAQITFRQIWNFISGDGITFNYAERVQAFTHPLWFLVLSLFGFVTQELFLTTIIVSTIFAISSVLLLMKIEFNQGKVNRTFISPVIFLIFSWAFCDYTTSGLENPLSFFLTGLLIYLLSFDNWKDKLQLIFIVLALLVLNRIDYSVLFFPLTMYLIWSNRNIKQLTLAIWPGTLLIFIWFIFAIFYFGSPFPNTYYAKLNAGYPFDEVLIRGWTYILSMSDDLASVFIIITALVLTMISRSAMLISLSIGQFLYCLYLLRSGGDFMLGRYFAILVLISVGQIIISLPLITRLNLSRKNFIILGIFVTLLLIGAFERYPFRSHIETDSRRPLFKTEGLDSHIIDERSYYRWIFGLLSEERNSWPKINVFRDQKPTDYRTACGLVGGSSLLNPNIYLIDVCGLTDPFLSRLPAIQVDSWRIGHHFRKIPKNYGDFKIGKVNHLDDPILSKMLNDIKNYLY